MATEALSRPTEILLVEDNRGDVRLIQEAFKAASVEHKLHVASDGEAALDFLYGRPPYETVPRPDIIILDLNIPKKNGRTVLNDIKSSSQLRRIPVIVLTTSNNEEDIIECYHLYANCYIAKPIDMGSFVVVVNQIKKYWFMTAKLPPH